MSNSSSLIQNLAISLQNMNHQYIECHVLLSHTIILRFNTNNKVTMQISNTNNNGNPKWINVEIENNKYFMNIVTNHSFQTELLQILNMGKDSIYCIILIDDEEHCIYIAQISKYQLLTFDKLSFDSEIFIPFNKIECVWHDKNNMHIAKCLMTIDTSSVKIYIYIYYNLRNNMILYN